MDCHQHKFHISPKYVMTKMTEKLKIQNNIALVLCGLNINKVIHNCTVTVYMVEVSVNKV